VTPRTPAQLAQSQLEAYNARDLEGFVSCYDAQVEVRRLPGDAVTARGRDGMRAVYSDLFARAPSLGCRLLHRIEHGSFVVDHEEVTGIPGRGTIRAVAIYEAGPEGIRRVWFLDAGRS